MVNRKKLVAILVGCLYGANLGPDEIRDISQPFPDLKFSISAEVGRDRHIMQAGDKGPALHVGHKSLRLRRGRCFGISHFWFA